MVCISLGSDVWQSEWSEQVEWDSGANERTNEQASERARVSEPLRVNTIQKRWWHTPKTFNILSQCSIVCIWCKLCVLFFSFSSPQISFMPTMFTICVTYNVSRLKVCRFGICSRQCLIAFYVIVDCVCVYVYDLVPLSVPLRQCACAWMYCFFYYILYLNSFYSVWKGRHAENTHTHSQSPDDSVNIHFIHASLCPLCGYLVHARSICHFVRTHSTLACGSYATLSQTLMFIFNFIFCFISFSSLVCECVCACILYPFATAYRTFWISIQLRLRHRTD